MPPKRKRSSTSRSPPPKKKKVRDESDYTTWTVEELREELSSKELSTKGTKQVLIDRLEGKEPEAPKTPTRPKRSAAKKAVASDSSEDEEEEKPRKRTTRAAAPKRGARKAPVRKKRDWEGSSDSEPEDENNESGSESPEEVPVAKSTRLPRAAARVVKTNPWTVEDSVVYCLPAESNDSDKVAAFDMDSTLIVTKSGKTFAQGRNDWKWLFEEVPAKLKEYHDNGYKIVIISNQAGVGKKTSVETVAGKILDLAEDAKVPLAFIFATGDDKYRKPATGMWELLQEKTGKTFDLKESFYVGDAAGRHEGWKPGVKKDFGCSDRKFAHNIPITFYTPEEFFLGEEPPTAWDWRGVVPDEVPETGKIADDDSDIVSTDKEMILFVGFPASGKSTFAKTHLIPHGYVHVNRDTLKTPAKCLKVAREALTEGKSVVVDNTNPSQKARGPYLALAKELGVPVRCYHFQTSQELAQHLNEFREVITDGDSPHVPTLVYRKFAKEFEEPTLDEGFSQIKKIHFVRSHPDEKHRTIFGKLTERHG